MTPSTITQPSQLQPTPLQIAQIERGYGLFLHFGINTFNNTEWSDGTLAAASYCPPAVQADQWVKTARDAGMRFVIVVAKHHEGFCLWNSRFTDYRVQASGNTTDVIRAVADACERHGLELGLYYSLWDRHEPCYGDDEKYAQFMGKQLEELMDGRYGKIAELWFDGGWEKSSSQWRLTELYDLVKRLQPGCAFGVNHTIGEWDSLGFASEEHWPVRYRENEEMKFFPSDFRLYDPHFPRVGPTSDPKIYSHLGNPYYLPFEATICIRNMTNWFWDPGYTKDPTVTPAFIAETYRALREQGNVLVVNCGPNTAGLIEEYDRQTLFEAARMLGIASGDALIAPV